MERRATSRRAVLGLAGGALAALAGCGGEGDGAGEGDGEDGRALNETEEPEMGTETATGAEEGAENVDDAEEEGGQEGGDARLRVAHVSPDADSVAVTVDGEPFLDSVSFGTVTDYQSVRTGQRAVTVQSAEGEETIFDGEIEIEEGAQTVVAFGEAAADDASFDVTVLADDDSPADSGGARVRVFHAVPNAQNVNITAGETVLAEDLAFGDNSAYVALEADVEEIQFRPAPAGEATPATAAEEDEETPTGEAVEETETQTDGQSEPIATFSPDLDAGGAYTLYAAGYLQATDDQSEAQLITATDAAVDGGAGATDTATATDTGGENETDGNETDASG